MATVMKHFKTLHQIPEVAFQEVKTAAYLEQELKAAGYGPVQVGETGLYADLLVDEALPWLVFRSDIDALPVTEETGLAYASQHPGVMHACGHDAHMAMLLTAAQQLAGQKLPQNIRFVFQPAEEITAGAKKMIKAGAVPENTVAAFGFHVWPGVPVGKVVAKAGPLMASSTRLTVTVTGKNAHCSKRHMGADALLTIAKVATRLQEAEAEAGNDGTVLFFGKMNSGTAHNIVADHAEMVGSLRSYDPVTRQKVLDKLEKIVAEAGAQYGTQAVLNAFAYNPAVSNPVALAEKVSALLSDLTVEMESSLASEDFSRYQEAAPGMFVWLGVGDTAALHNGKFQVPQEILPVGVDAWLRIANHKW